MTEYNAITRDNFVKRFVLPSAIVLVMYILLHTLYFESWKIDNRAVQYYVGFVSGLMLFFFIGFNSLVVYMVIYFKGASVYERILASLLVQIVWIGKELVRVSEFFTFGETIYYMFNSAFLLAIMGSFALMGVAELVCRWLLNKRGVQQKKVITPLPVCAIVTGIVAVYVFLIWGIGEHWFYIYVMGYKLIFH